MLIQVLMAVPFAILIIVVGMVSSSFVQGFVAGRKDAKSEKERERRMRNFEKPDETEE